LKAIRWWYKQLLYKSTLPLEVQTVAFYINPYAGGPRSCFLNQPLRWYKQLLHKLTPYVEGTNSCFLTQLLRWC